ncbi:MAG: hypothetical protein JNL70_24645 [Saprospiraceae bacterium]|nr:hypothetical protein [Saprospiraceae bacterium]
MFGLFKKKNTIQSEILSDLRQAKKSIKVAVSWLTDPLLLTELIDKTKQGVDVKILLSANELNIIRFEHFVKLQELGASVQKWGNEEATQGSFMHYKFYIIDDYLAKSGSYNWSINATSNAEALDQVPVTKKITEFNELFPVSVDFFTEIDNPEQKRAELEYIRKEQKQDILTPEMLKAYRDTQKIKKEYADRQRIQEEETRIAKQKTHELELRLAEQTRLAKIEADEKQRKEREAQQKAKELEIQLAKEQAERDRLAKIEADRKAKEQAAQYKPKEEVKATTLPPTSYA